MAIQARVTSTDALETFRAKLIVFVNKARLSVDDVSDEVRRTKSWLQHDQTVRWGGEIRRRVKVLDQAQQELRNAQLGGSGQHSTMQTRQAAVDRAKQALTEAEDKLRRVKKWSQNYDTYADPVVKRLESFRGLITDELPKAVAHLRNVQKALDAYAETAAPSSGSATAAAPGEASEPGPSAPSTGSSAP